MKTIGLIGGLSWESTTEYYRHINRIMNERLGSLHSAKCLLYSLDFEEIVKLQERGDWEEATRIMVESARILEKGGADVVVICTNTMHKMADEVQAAIRIPLLHIVDVTAERIKKQGLTKVGVLGTRYTMEQAFYRERLNRHGIEVIIPESDERDLIHGVLRNELFKGNCLPESRAKFIAIIERLHAQGAEGIVLGCTEIPLLIQQQDTRIPLFDTTRIHAEESVEFAIASNYVMS
ncbi:aspartate/glutamate racemase family protein [Paenibacillus sp. SYP-B3998]|uniref:Aspartate/glutamate racemase family protein n=1 Tax=Paenibacillus sp. SYP-B3998 TaxID=2678564 RepID=A0A6G3ZS59_9BACL|nr:aspartate/glutamate racemase family protein [Paenibacillus sp. SYP-B3998]NEW04955.1 aspartate/glutamate racemase family protein [Paenibacillus sp. SYP-B3998]